jgi:hypothetical protein
MLQLWLRMEESSRMHMMAHVRPGPGLCSDKPKLKELQGQAERNAANPALQTCCMAVGMMVENATGQKA